MNCAQHAVHTLLWSNNFDDFEPSKELVEKVTEMWDKFREQAEAIGFDAYKHRKMMINSSEGDEWDYAAHDFILTCNGHGAGFWDGGWHDPWGDKLTTLCKSFPHLDVWGDDDRTAQLY